MSGLLALALYPEICIPWGPIMDTLFTMDVVLGHIQDRGLDTDIPVYSLPLKLVRGMDRINRLKEISIQTTSLRDIGLIFFN